MQGSIEAYEGVDYKMLDKMASEALNSLKKIPDYPAFLAFARALWENEAAVMVGAGFSRVCRREVDSPVPPLWSTFQSEMEEALGYRQGEGPDALRLAQEYKTMHGENGMHHLILQLVADSQWEPGKLHKQLLELPWRDVLTTNWDTLLERTKPQTPDRIYSCVHTIQDIAHRARPRIVKLHGSMPSHKPFIFTEDDYRTYPVQFAPFVNLAQQVMLEHDLCLIGFSGLDPNFLAWSGWVRDTLNVSARCIRLVGVLELSPVSRTLLERRNVTPIDLAPLVTDVNRDEQHEKALELFFAALLAAKPPSPYEWIKGSDNYSQSNISKEEERPTREDVVKNWGKIRCSYPGWIIAPKREIYQLRNSFPAIQNVVESAEIHLRFNLERIWRHRTARICLNMQDINEANVHYENGQQKLTDQEKVLLCTSIAAEWRYRRKWDEWTQWMARLAAVGGSNASMHHAYETGQRAVIDWDDATVLNATVSLKSDNPLWMMRRAGLLTTLFRYREAAELYQAALLKIRQKLLSAPKSAWLISLEGWAALFHQVSYSALTDDCFLSLEAESDETRMRYVAAKADPWDIITGLEALASERIHRNYDDSKKWKISFKPGRYSAGGTKRLGFDYECPFYGLLEVIERTGAPERIASVNVFSSRLETAYRAIANPDENDLLTFFARYRGSEIKILDWALSRMQIACLSDNAVQHFLAVIPQRMSMLTKLEDCSNASTHLKFLLELLARVIVRASSSRAFEIFEWITNLLNQPTLSWMSYSACRKVLEGGVEAMEPEERQKALHLALHLKTPGEAGGEFPERDWPEIFDSFLEEDIQELSITAKDVDRISSLIGLVKDGAKLDRSRALRRLYSLHLARKLTDDQVKLLDVAIWGRCDEHGWPSDTELYPWTFLDFPSKERAESLFIGKIIGGVVDGKIDYEILINFRAGLDRIETVLPKETLVACVKSCLMWQPNSIDDKSLVDRVLSGIESQDQATASEIGEVLARSLLPRLEVKDIPQDIVEILKAPEKLPHIPSLVAVAYQVARLCPDRQSIIFKQIRYAMASREPSHVYPAFFAVKQAVESATIDKGFHREIKELLLNACEQRIQPGLCASLSLLAEMHQGNQLDQGDIERLLSALIYILKEYHYEQKNLDIPVMAELPTVRREIHRILKKMQFNCSEIELRKIELANDPLPEVRFVT